MGQASIKKKLRQAAQASLDAIDLKAAAQAVRQTCDALTDARGFDCLLYAHVGAGLLQHLGAPASAAAGGAAWRVGPGDSDVLNHYPGGDPAQSFRPDVASPAVMFHSWVDVQGIVVDFTTWALGLKAQQLDAADGGSTRVDWSPDYLCTPIEGAKPLRDVIQGYDVGLFGYQRMPAIEERVLGIPEKGIYDQAIAAAIYAYSAIRNGGSVKVVCLDKETDGNASLTTVRQS